MARPTKISPHTRNQVLRHSIMPKYTSLILETRHQLQMTVKFTPSHVTSGKESAGTSWIEVCVTCSANLDVLERINICNPCRESKQEWSVVQPVDKSPYRLGSPNQRSFMKLFCYDPARWLWMGWCAILCRTVSHTTQLDKLFCYAVWKWIVQEEARQVVMLWCVETSHATGSRNPFDQVITISAFYFWGLGFEYGHEGFVSWIRFFRVFQTTAWIFP